MTDGEEQTIWCSWVSWGEQFHVYLGFHVDSEPTYYWNTLVISLAPQTRAPIEAHGLLAGTGEPRVTALGLVPVPCKYKSPRDSVFQ